ncbi:acyl-CoA reductase [Persicobacter sp. CCB-QB2]|uniref:acyl-CoA reductase n=1 Tax=Persicobacter sp. CCB-QB2 TaxID=1561025 RepID=UPI0006A97BF9|nr:acyl-CoA reductase [Persicobacter sp. CCB-QB2]
MTVSERIKGLAVLGQYLRGLSKAEKEGLFFSAESKNNWFTPSNVEEAFNGILLFLEASKLQELCQQHQGLSNNFSDKKIGLVLAGNIPMVGFHDLLCVLLSGHRALIKLSSQDEVLMKFIINSLKEICPPLYEQITIAERLNDADAFIATGSDNTARYFHHYFSKKPNIIRKNRTSLAILSGNESEEDFKGLGKDIFTFFGLGCRNISKVLVPEGYNFTPFLDALQSYKAVGDHHKYANNYDYNKSILLVNRVPHLDSGFLLLQQSEAMVSPISVLFYETYKTEEDIKQYLSQHQEKIQCVVGNATPYIPFGKAQAPEIDDFADNVDTLAFLQDL